MKGCYLEFLTWQEAEEVFKDKPLAVVPIGARLKEHGLHLPLNNDWIIAEYLVKRILEILPVIAIPTIPYGYYPSFIEYPGSTHLREELFEGTVTDICKSLIRHGLSKIYILNTGVSTLEALARIKTSLSSDSVSLRYTNPLEAIKEVEGKLRKQERGTHADEIETSMMLYMAPEVVHMEKAKWDARPRKNKGPLSRTESDIGVYSPTGAWGDPTLATYEKGKILVEAMVTAIFKDISDLESTHDNGLSSQVE